MDGLALAFILLASAVPLGSAPSLAPGPASLRPAELRIGFLQPVDSLNPYRGISPASLVLYSLLYDFPFSYDPDGTPVPNLVTPASCANPACSTWNYTVRQGVSWSDWTELTSADVNFTWNYDSQNLAKLWEFEPYFNHVVVCTTTNRLTCGARISPTNPWNVTVYFDAPFAAGRDLSAPIVEAAQWMGISPAAAETSYQNPDPIGTGPFIADPNLYSEWLGGGSLHVTRNLRYHPVGENITGSADLRVADINISSYSNAAAMASALEAGQLDLAEFTTSTIAPLRGQPNILVQSALEAIRAWNYVGISQCDTPTADSVLNPARLDVNVRRALAHATNKDYIVQAIYGVQGVRGDSLLSPIAPAWWYNPVAGGDNLTFDVAQANAILNGSGYTTWSGGSFGHGIREATNPISVSFQSSNGSLRVENITNVTETIPAGKPLTFTLAVRLPADFPEENETAHYLQTQWARIGVQVNIKEEATESALSNDVYGCYVEAYIWYWSSDPDPSYMLSMQSSWTLDGWNDNSWVNTSYNRLYLAELGDLSLSRRAADVQAAEKLQYEQAPDIIYLYPYGEWAMRTDLWQGWGNWTHQPYLQMDVARGANPLWFNVTCPTCQPMPANLPPLVYTAAASGITATSAMLNDNLGSLESATSVTVGFIWGTSPTLVGAANRTAGVVSAAGIYGATVTGLTPTTTYYFEAWANGAGFSHGTTASFTTATPPSVTTNPASTVTTTTAVLNGATTGLGTASSVTVGFLWSTNPTLSAATVANAGAQTAPASFNATLTGLSPGVTYYFEAWANGSGFAHGSILSLAAAVTPPSVTTSAATPVGATTATLNGQLTGIGTASSVAFGFLWGTLSNLAGAANDSLGSVNGLAQLRDSITGLTPATTYYFRVWAKGDGFAEGGVLSFTTSVSVPPTVTTQTPLGVASTAATLDGSLSDMGSATSVTVGFLWSINADLSGGTNVTVDVETGVTGFTADLAGLSQGTTYYYETWGLAGGRFVHGSIVSFTTAREAPPPPATFLGLPVAEGYGLLIVIVIIVGLLAVLLLQRRRRRSPPENPSPPQNP